MRWPRATADVEAGFAAIDAGVALLLLSTTLVLAMGGAQSARRLAGSALETRRASNLMHYALETAPRAAGVVSGHSNGFSWSVDTGPQSGTQAGPVQICSRVVRLESLSTGKHFTLRGAEICPARAGL